MALEVMESTGTYHLLYYQPRPEDGERVCVAILAGRDRDAEVIYDPAFQKVRCIAPTLPAGLIKMYLDEMGEELRTRPLEREIVLKKFAPQLVPSGERKIQWPLTDAKRASLIERFLRSRQDDTKNLADAQAKNDVELEVDNELFAIVQRLAPKNSVLIRAAGPADIVGFKVQGIKEVAVAVRRASETILIDGVDLRLSKPRATLSRVTRVVHTFWQYDRVRSRDWLTPVRLLRVGVVLNGATGADRAYRDAHDFALDQFAKTADESVDAGSDLGLMKLEKLVATGVIRL